jgi:hypothetical protein
VNNKGRGVRQFLVSTEDVAVGDVMAFMDREYAEADGSYLGYRILLATVTELEANRLPQDSVTFSVVTCMSVGARVQPPLAAGSVIHRQPAEEINYNLADRKWEY